MAVEVRDAAEAERYEARIDAASEVAGFAEYIRTSGVIEFVHTEVSPQYEGKGIGSELARAALDEARAAGLYVVPSCPFIAAWIDRHPEYQDLLDQARSSVDD